MRRFKTLDTVLTEWVIIRGRMKTGGRIKMPLRLERSPEQTTEQAIIKAFKSQAQDFDALMTEQGIQDAEWTFNDEVLEGVDLPWKEKLFLSRSLAAMQDSLH